MKINIDAIKALELKLAEYSKENGIIAEHASENVNSCRFGCTASCYGTCQYVCLGACTGPVGRSTLPQSGDIS